MVARRMPEALNVRVPGFEFVFGAGSAMVEVDVRGQRCWVARW